MGPHVVLGISWCLRCGFGICALPTAPSQRGSSARNRERGANIRFLLADPEGDTQIGGVGNQEEDRLLLRSDLNCLVKRSQFQKMPF